jgi:hypothetical protein
MNPMPMKVERVNDGKTGELGEPIPEPHTSVDCVEVAA